MKRNIHFGFLISLVLLSCKEETNRTTLREDSIETASSVSLVVLGTVQDAGSPQIACTKECCAPLFENPDHTRKVVSLGLIDSENKKTFLLEATPDIAEQLKALKKIGPHEADELPSGIFLTHAHIGHYTGLMYLGKEATNTENVPVYTMPRMKGFLEQNGPWSQLVSNKNIVLESIESGKAIQLADNFEVVPFAVPHRDEYSETVGYLIIGPNKTALFIPDIDKWGKWDQDIVETISKVDYAFLDATFYDAEEINNRDIAEIPHPFVVESMELFKNLLASEKKKIHFIHFNHTNPLLNPNSRESLEVLKNGFNIARIDNTYDL